VIGFHSIIYISSTLDNPENMRLRNVLHEKFGPRTESSAFTVGAYDGMQVAYKMIAAMGGKPFDGDAAVKSVLGFSYRSPRGPVTIDQATRENIQNFYVRRVEMKDGRMQNVIIKTFEQVKPPGPKS
jgi:branched-chain amino acid transport system substrate-binding protein